MEYLQFGNHGMRVSRLALGMLSYGSPEWRPWVLDGEEATPYVATAAEAGVNFFETGDTYSRGASEVSTGKALRTVFDNREDYVIASNVWGPMGEGPNDRGSSRRHIIMSVDAALRRLDTDYIDLYQLHRWDAATPVEESMSALHDCVVAGKIHYIGATTMQTWQFAKLQMAAAANGWTRLASYSCQYNLLYREEEREAIPMCIDGGLALLPWSPLARGVLTRARDDRSATLRGATDFMIPHHYDSARPETLDLVEAVARRRGVSRAQVALAWVMSKPGVTAPIVGATSVEQLRDVLGSLDLSLDDEEVVELESAYVPRLPIFR